MPRLIPSCRNGMGSGHGDISLLERADVQDVHGIAVRVAALDDVIASKELADRPKDREALIELRELDRGGG